jgi:hypothetical protein
VPRSSPYHNRLLELNNELNHDIEVVEVDESSDRLIRELAGGEIDYTVAPENMAGLRSGEFHNLVIRPAIGPPQPIVWAARRTSPNLRGALDAWIAAKKKAGLLAALYRKYLLDRQGFQRRGAASISRRRPASSRRSTRGSGSMLRLPAGTGASSPRRRFRNRASTRRRCRGRRNEMLVGSRACRVEL